MTVTQLGFFGEDRKLRENYGELVFWLKKHDARIAGLHYDLRFQFVEFRARTMTKKFAKSFALKSAPSFDPEDKIPCVLVDDHEVSAIRREGTILEGTGTGYLIH